MITNNIFTRSIVEIVLVVSACTVYVDTCIYHINFKFDKKKIGLSVCLSLTRFHPYWIRAYPPRPRVLVSQTVVSIWVSTGFSGSGDPIIVGTGCVNDVKHFDI